MHLVTLLAAAAAMGAAVATPSRDARDASEPALADAGEPVRLSTADRLTLSASYFSPSGRTGLAPGAIVVHDAGADRQQVAGIAVYLQKKGFGVLTVDLRGHGQSGTTEMDWAQMDERGQQRLWSFAGRDVSAAADNLRLRKEIHASNLSLIGVGAGCTLAVRHAIDDANTRAVVLVAPSSKDYGFNLERGIGDLEGLPTLIVSTSDGRDLAERLQTVGNGSSAGAIELSVVRGDSAGSLLDETRTRSETYKWLKDQVMPKRN